MESDFVEFNGERIYFSIQKKKIKNMNLRVHRDLTITLSIPMKMSVEKAKEFVKKKWAWIKKQQKFYEACAMTKENLDFNCVGITYLLGKPYELETVTDINNQVKIIDNRIKVHVKEKYIHNQKYVKNIYDKWLRKYALSMLNDRVLVYQRYLDKYKVPMPKVEIKQMKSTWGICRPKEAKITFNVNLIKSPMSCVEYVVLHELSHFRYPNHSKNFYDFVEKFMPDWKTRKDVLNSQYLFM